MKKTLITLAALAMASVASALEVSDAQLALVQGTMGNITLSTATMGLHQATTDSPFSSADGAYTAILILDWDTMVGSNGVGAHGGYAGTQIFKTTATNDWGDGWAHGFNLWVNGDFMYASLLTEVTGGGYEQRNPLEDGAEVEGSTTNILESNGNNAQMHKDTYPITLANGDKKLAVALSFDPTTSAITFYGVQSNGVIVGTGSYTPKNVDNDDTWTPEDFDKMTFNENFVEHAIVFNRVLSTEEIAAVAMYVIPEPTTATLSLLALAGLAARRRRK